MEGRILGLLLLSLVMVDVRAVNVIIPLEMYEHARGDNITLPCSFTTKLTNPPLVIITWSVESEIANAKETVIITHYSKPEKTDIKSIYEGRVALDVNVANGKANLKLFSITLQDNKIFECRVLIPGDDEGKPADTTKLQVLVAPSKPVCKIQGKAEYGQNINLTCLSEEGSPTPTYKWQSHDVRNAPRLADPRTTDKGGVLSLFNISKETSGYYTCTSSNKIRSATCNITLAVMPPSINIGSTTIIIIVVIGVLLLLAIIIFFCCRRHKKKKQQEAYTMGVRQGEYDDKEEPPRNGESRRADGQEDESRGAKPEDRDTYEEHSERGYDDRRRDSDDRRRDYDDRRSDYDDRRSDYNDPRRDYDDRRRDYDDRRSDYDDRRSDYSDRRDRYSDRDERYNDARRYDDRRDRPKDDDRYDEPYDDRPPVPNNKPLRRDYDD